MSLNPNKHLKKNSGKNSVRAEMRVWMKDMSEGQGGECVSQPVVVPCTHHTELTSPVLWSAAYPKPNLFCSCNCGVVITYFKGLGASDNWKLETQIDENTEGTPSWAQRWWTKEVTGGTTVRVSNFSNLEGVIRWISSTLPLTPAEARMTQWVDWEK